MLVTFKNRGDFSKTDKFFNRLLRRDYLNVLEKYGQQGVAALSASTPVKTGKTASSWEYIITHSPTETKIEWVNTNVVAGTNVAILLQYGHGTKNGGYVVGRDFINPALRPIFDKMANEVWKEVTKA